MSISQTQSLNQSQKLTPKQIQLINVLSLPTIAIEQFVANEMALNPVLEFDVDDQQPEEYADDLSHDNDISDEPDTGKLGEDYDYTDYMDREGLDDYKYESNNHLGEDTKREKVFTESPHFTVSLISQLELLPISEREKEFGKYLIYSFDNDGYLRRDLGDLADELSFIENAFVEEAELQEILDKVRKLEPLGIGARNLQECMLLQLEHKTYKTKETYLAIDIITDHLDKLASKDYAGIQQALDIDDEDMEDTLEEIRGLNPCPGGSMSEDGGKAPSICPDFTVVVEGDNIELFLNSPYSVPLRINNEYKEMAQEYANSKDKQLRDASGFIKSKIEHAKWFIDALQQREKLMTSVVRVIVNFQHQYLITGDELDLKPMILKDIAELTNSDISTVSRIVNSKYIQTDQGVILLKKLFVHGMETSSGEMVSTIEVKKALLECIEAEDRMNPLSDEEISNLMMQKKYAIARRTVAKYRDELNIPNKNFRKQESFAMQAR